MLQVNSILIYIIHKMSVLLKMFGVANFLNMKVKVIDIKDYQ